MYGSGRSIFWFISIDDSTYSEHSVMILKNQFPPHFLKIRSYWKIEFTHTVGEILKSDSVL